MLSTVFYNMSRPNTRPDTTHDHGQQLASMSGTAQPSHIALVSVVQEVIMPYVLRRSTLSMCVWARTCTCTCKHTRYWAAHQQRVVHAERGARGEAEHEAAAGHLG